MDELRKKTVIGSFWALLERFGYLGIQFISNVVLSRLLMPSDFGTIGILMVFTTISYVLIDSGLSSALIQKRTISEEDKSTVFFTNFVLGIFVYTIIFFSSPSIADYFHNPEIKNLLRILELIVVIDSFAAIQSTTLAREMNFKILTICKLFSIAVAVIVSIILAYQGMGVWALVVQYLLFSVFRASFLWLRTKWRPVILFSKTSFNSLFGFGSKLLVSTFISTVYGQLLSIIIGRRFSASDLGYYTQARQLMQIPTESLGRVVNNVSFPAYSKIQSERQKLKVMVRQNLLILLFINTPLMFFLSTSARPLLIFLYSEKWIESIPYFRFLCLGFGLLIIVHDNSLTALKSVGRTDSVLKLEIIKKILGVILLLVGMHFFGIWGLMYALAINSLFELFLNGHYLKKEIDYGPWDQIKDLLRPLLISLFASFVIYIFLTYVPISNNFILLFLSFLIFWSIYLLGAYYMRLEALNMLRNIAADIISRKRGN